MAYHQQNASQCKFTQPRFCGVCFLAIPSLGRNHEEDRRGPGRARLTDMPSRVAGNSRAGQALTLAELRIAGPEFAPYQLGKPMYLYDGESHVGTVEAVTVLRDGHDVHIDRFVPAALSMRQSRVSRNLVVVEIVAFLANHFATVATIRVSLRSPVETHDDILKVASARAHLLRRIGAQQINIIPSTEPSNRGNFTVYGVWTRNSESLENLNAALCDEIRAHRSRRAAAATVRGRLARLGEWMQRLLQGSTDKGI